MPSEHRRRKDDTWTSEELNHALKGSKDEMHRKKRRDDDGERRRHHDDVNGSSRRKDDERRSHRRDEDEKKSRRHKDRGDSPEVQLTEEDRERLRQERRAKREGGKEEKKSRPKENSKPPKIIDDDDDDHERKRRHRDRDEDRHSERRRHHEEGESRKHREDKDRDKDRERRHHDKERRRDEDDDVDRRRRHKEEGSSRRHHDDSERHRRHEDSSDRRRHQEEESKHRKHGDDDDAERERRRQERREKREREQRSKDKEKEKGRDRDEDRGSRRRKEETEEDRGDRRRHEKSERDRDRDRDREKDRDRRDRDREREAEKESERRSSRHRQREETPEPPASASNGRHKVEEEANGDDDEDGNDYDYEEDFEDYEDDFEDDEDPEMKEEGEMEEVLRALDEENNRLVSASRRSNWSDSTELSDERFKDDEPVSRMAPRAKTFINFVSAKQRVMDHTLAGKARKRFEDLSKLIELDVAKFDMFDLPPVKEYELYIRSFGRSDTKQAYVQTHEDDIERDVQTEEIESLSKWTQHPPDEDTAVGGEGITVQAPDFNQDSVRKADPDRLDKFLDRVGQFLFTILDEESSSYEQEERHRDGKPTASFSEKATQLGMPNFLTGRQVIALSFCQSEPNYLLSVHSSPSDAAESAKDLSTIRSSSPVEGEKQAALQALSIICVWNLAQLAYPYRICVSEMKITCGCFSPTKASLVFGGMHDGSVALWDLREPVSQHRTMEMDGQEHLVRFPTYNTAGVAESDNHHSPVVSIVPVYSSIVGSHKDEEAAESSSGLSFQLASVEEKAMVNLWVVAEIAVADPAGSENDLGLSPGGRIKLLRSSAIVLNNPNKYLSTSSELKALDLHLNPGDLNHFYVGTDAGCVVHGVRFGKRAYPQSHSSLVDSPVPIVTLDFSPFGQPYFLAGCQDGTLHLFNTKLENPIASWREFVSGETILSVRWSQSRPAVFFVLDNNSTIFTFDLVENGLAPIKMDRITAADATHLEVGGDPNLLTPGTHRSAYMVLALDNGTAEVLSISDEMRTQQPLEEEFLETYVDRY